MIKVTSTEAKNHFSRYISMVQMQNEKIVIEKGGKSVAMIIPFPAADAKESSFTSRAELDALPSNSDRFVGIIKEADLDYHDSRTEYLLKKYL